MASTFDTLCEGLSAGLRDSQKEIESCPLILNKLHFINSLKSIEHSTEQIRSVL